MKELAALGTLPSTLPLFSVEKTGHSTSNSKYNQLPGRWKMEGLLGYVIQSQAVPRIRARTLKSAPGEKHLHGPQQQPLRPICQTRLTGGYQLMRRVSLSRGRAPNLGYFGRTHFKGQSASTERSSIKTVQRRESKPAVLSAST